MSKLEDLLEYVKEEGRICPNPKEWDALWKMLSNRKQVGSSWEPLPPIILAAWYDTSAMTKSLRLQEHIHYAAEHGLLEKVDIYLRSLHDEQWFYG